MRRAYILIHLPYLSSINFVLWPQCAFILHFKTFACIDKQCWRNKKLVAFFKFLFSIKENLLVILLNMLSFISVASVILYGNFSLNVCPNPLLPLKTTNNTMKKKSVRIIYFCLWEECVQLFINNLSFAWCFDILFPFNWNHDTIVQKKILVIHD